MSPVKRKRRCILPVLALGLLLFVVYDTQRGRREQREKLYPRAQHGKFIFTGQLDPQLDLVAVWSYQTTAESWWCRDGYSFAMGDWHGKEQKHSTRSVRVDGGRYKLEVELLPPRRQWFFDCRWFLDGPHLVVSEKTTAYSQRIALARRDRGNSKLTIPCKWYEFRGVLSPGESPLRFGCAQEELRVEDVYGSKYVAQVDVVVVSEQEVAGDPSAD